MTNFINNQNEGAIANEIVQTIFDCRTLLVENDLEASEVNNLIGPFKYSKEDRYNSLLRCIENLENKEKDVLILALATKLAVLNPDGDDYLTDFEYIMIESPECDYWGTRDEIDAVEKQLYQILKEVRLELKADPRNIDRPDLDGECILASEMFLKKVKKLEGIKATMVEAWVLYEDDSCTGDPYTPHAYVEVLVGKDKFYCDCTATQFNWTTFEKSPPVMVLKNEIPRWIRFEEPKEEAEELLNW